MRTTVDIEEDVLSAIKELARREGITAGAMISTLLRQALTKTERSTALTTTETSAHFGFRPLPAGKVIGNDHINQLRDEQGI